MSWMLPMSAPSRETVAWSISFNPSFNDGIRHSRELSSLSLASAAASAAKRDSASRPAASACLRIVMSKLIPT
jgi:hypothetical protein